MMMTSAMGIRRQRVRWRPGQKARLEPQRSNLSSFSEENILHLWQCWDISSLPAVLRSHTVIKRPGNCDPLAPPSLRLWLHHLASPLDGSDSVLKEILDLSESVFPPKFKRKNFPGISFDQDRSLMKCVKALMNFLKAKRL